MIFLNANVIFATEDGFHRPWRADPVLELKSRVEQNFSIRSTPIASFREFADIQRLDSAFSIPVEPYPMELNSLPHWDLSELHWDQRLKIFDPGQSFRRFMILDPNRISVFQDRDLKTVPDFEVLRQPLAPTPAVPPRDPAQPLKGLRIALDPGHVGAPLWDRRDGKYVQDKKGRVLSEGTMALQVSMLLEAELIALGAEVFLTHRGFQPVFQDGTYEKFLLRKFAEDEFRSSRLTDWFLKLLTIFSSANIVAGARADKNVQRIFQDSQWSRYRYFFQRAELQARADAINQFQPDLTVIIHFDIDAAGNNHGLNPQNYNSTKAFVPGHFEFSEVATRAERAQLVRGLVRGSVWDNSVKLSRLLTRSISTHLGIPQDKGNPGFVTRIEPGVFARNLGLLRRLESPVTYLECLFYNGPTEFEKLVAKDFSMMIDGKQTFYSARLKSLVEAIREGLLAYRP